MKSRNRQYFKVRSFVGTDIAQTRPYEPRIPQAAKLVADLEMDPMPGAGVTSIYFLSSNPDRSVWTLWAEAPNDREDGRAQKVIEP